MKQPNSRRVVCAALRADDGEVIVGIRHYSPDMVRQIQSRPDGEKFNRLFEDSQGFVDQYGEYMTRQEAWQVAQSQHQIIRDVGCANILFSENLY